MKHTQKYHLIFQIHLEIILNRHHIECSTIEQIFRHIKKYKQGEDICIVFFKNKEIAIQNGIPQDEIFPVTLESNREECFQWIPSNI